MVYEYYMLVNSKRFCVLVADGNDGQAINMSRDGIFEPRKTMVVSLVGTRHRRAIKSTDYEVVSRGKTISKLLRCRHQVNVSGSFKRSTIPATSCFASFDSKERRREREREREGGGLIKCLIESGTPSRSFHY